MFIVHHTNMPLNDCFGSSTAEKKHRIHSIIFSTVRIVFIKINDLFFLSLFIVVHLQSSSCVFVFIQLHLVYKDMFGRASYSTPLNILIQIRQASRFIRVCLQYSFPVSLLFYFQFQLSVTAKQNVYYYLPTFRFIAEVALIRLRIEQFCIIIGRTKPIEMKRVIY